MRECYLCRSVYSLTQIFIFMTFVLSFICYTEYNCVGRMPGSVVERRERDWLRATRWSTSPILKGLTSTVSEPNDGSGPGSMPGRFGGS